jgi:hypothetical protein
VPEGFVDVLHAKLSGKFFQESFESRFGNIVEAFHYELVDYGRIESPVPVISFFTRRRDSRHRAIALEHEVNTLSGKLFDFLPHHPMRRVTRSVKAVYGGIDLISHEFEAHCLVRNRAFFGHENLLFKKLYRRVEHNYTGIIIALIINKSNAVFPGLEP